MVCRHNEELEYLVTKAKKVTDKGKVASTYRLWPNDRRTIYRRRFTFRRDLYISGGRGKNIYSAKHIKSIVPCPRLMDHGPKKVFHYVGQEPTGDPFNSIIKLETVNPSKPLNPMINAGALVVTSMIKGGRTLIRSGLDHLLDFIRRLANNRSITFAGRSPNLN